jgi:cellulose synthase operon protein YhjQ
MTERVPPDPNETPEDVASLYSWANLHGGKYRDFSASRAETREKTRQRMEEAIEEERQRARQEAAAQPPSEAGHVVEESRRHELAAQQAADLAAHEAAQERARRAGEFVAQHTQAAAHAQQQVPQQTSQQFPQQIPQQAAWPRPPQDRPIAPPPQPARPSAPAASQPIAAHADEVSQQRAPWLSTDPRENTDRPAWLMPEKPDSINQPAPLPATLPSAPEDTLQGSRDRLVSRWFALRSVFEDNVPTQSAPAPTLARAPVLAIFSLAGGVGKTSLVATLGRVLSARGERVLLVDTAAYGLLPFFFGARDQRPGLLRTFSPPVASGDAPIQMITLDPDTLDSELATAEALTAEILKHARGVSRVVVDLATASGATTRRVMRLSPQILVPLVPDMGSVVSVASIDAFFDHNNGNGKPALPYYVLNQFDPSLPLHLDVREVLREQLGDRLLPFTLRRTPAVSEALAEGMTVVDYAPNSAVTEDYASLAGWVKSLSAPASSSFRGVRWSER